MSRLKGIPDGLSKEILHKLVISSCVEISKYDTNVVIYVTFTIKIVTKYKSYLFN